MALSERWQNHIEAWKNSGLSQADYCRQHGINANTFSGRYRLYKLQPSSPASLIPVQIVPSKSTTTPIVLRHTKGHRLEIPSTLSAQWIAELLQCLA